MTGKGKSVLIAVIVALTAGGAAAIASAAGGEDDDGAKAISGRSLDRASAAALAATGGGKVTETEVGDEEGAYEVEVTLAGGSQVDVHLDERFSVLSTARDGDGPDDADHSDE